MRSSPRCDARNENIEPLSLARSLGRTIPHYRTNYRRIKYGKYIERREFRALPDIINRDIICRGRCPRVNANYNPAHTHPFLRFLSPFFWLRVSFSHRIYIYIFGLPLLSRSNEQLERSRQKLRSRARSQIFISCINVLPRGLLIIRAIDMRIAILSHRLKCVQF